MTFTISNAVGCVECGKLIKQGDAAWIRDIEAFHDTCMNAAGMKRNYCSSLRVVRIVDAKG